MSTLELIATDDLILELTRRFDSVVLVGSKVTNETKGFNRKFFRRWCGNSHECIGLLVEMQEVILDDLSESSETLDE